MTTTVLSGGQVTFGTIKSNQATTVQSTSEFGCSDEFGFYRGLLKFDTSGITGPVTVSAATITATASLGAPNGTQSIDFLKLLANPVIGQATYNDRATGTAWATPGAFDATDADLTPAFTLTSLNTSGANTDSSAGLIALCQDWINNPGNNKGLLVKKQSETNSGSFVLFGSASLSITYTADGGGSSEIGASNVRQSSNRRQFGIRR